MKTPSTGDAIVEAHPSSWTGVCEIYYVNQRLLVSKQHVLSDCQNQISWSISRAVTCAWHQRSSVESELLMITGSACQYVIFTLKYPVPTLLCFAENMWEEKWSNKKKVSVKRWIAWCQVGEQILEGFILMSARCVNKHWHVQITVKEENSLSHLDEWAVLSENMRAPAAQ